MYLVSHINKHGPQSTAKCYYFHYLYNPVLLQDNNYGTLY